MGTLITLAFWALGLVTFFIFMFFAPINLWLTAVSSGIWTTPSKLMIMRVKRVPPRIIIESAINAKKAGVKVSIDKMADYYLAGGHVPSVIKAMIAAKNHDFRLSFEEAAKIDLGGFDVFHLVMVSGGATSHQWKNIIEIDRHNIHVLNEIHFQIKFSDIDIKNFADIELLQMRASSIIMDVFNSIEDFSTLKMQPSLITEKIKKELKTDDIDGKLIDIALVSMNEISEEKILEIGLKKGFEKVDIDNSVGIKVGDIGEVWYNRKAESASAYISKNICDVYLSQQLQEKSKVKVTKVYGGEVHVELLTDKETDT